MVTRSKVGTYKYKIYIALQADLTLIEPSPTKKALAYHLGKSSLELKFDAFKKNWYMDLSTSSQGNKSNSK